MQISEVKTAAEAHFAPKRKGTKSEEIAEIPTKIANETVAFNSIPW